MHLICTLSKKYLLVDGNLANIIIMCKPYWLWFGSATLGYDRFAQKEPQNNIWKLQTSVNVRRHRTTLLEELICNYLGSACIPGLILQETRLQVERPGLTLLNIVIACVDGSDGEACCFSVLKSRGRDGLLHLEPNIFKVLTPSKVRL